MKIIYLNKYVRVLLPKIGTSGYYNMCKCNCVYIKVLHHPMDKKLREDE